MADFALPCTLVWILSLSTATLALGGSQAVNLWRLNREISSRLFVCFLAYRCAENAHIPSNDSLKLQADGAGYFQTYFFEQPLDHFSNSTHTTFNQRYWFSDRHFVPNSGAPVIVFDGGEGRGTDRFPILDSGIVDILAKATGGLGVVLEHRYYGVCYGSRAKILLM